MITKNLARRLERLEAEIIPACGEEKVFVIISVSPDGQRVDSGIRIRVPGVLKPVKERFR
jgi:hypothetical protein